MKIKIDENLPIRLKFALTTLGHDVDTAADEGLSGKPDEDVWRAAQATERFLVTMDLDFSDVRQYPPGEHAGLLIVRLPERDQHRATEFVLAWFERYDVEAWARCVVVGTPVRLRVRAQKDE